MLRSVFLFFIFCFLTHSALAIYGGELVPEDSPLAQSSVAIIDPTTNTHECSGTLISDQFVLTAAHCVVNFAGTEFELSVVYDIHFGIDIKKPTAIRKGIRVFAHPDYKLEEEANLAHNDLALIQFEGGIPQGFFPAPLADETISLLSIETLTAVGFGVSVQPKNSDPWPDIASAGKMRVAELEFIKLQTETNILVVSQDNGKGFCNIDSGGSGYLSFAGKYSLIGVIFAGEKGTCDGEGYLVYVTPYIPWINSIILNP